MGSYVAQASGVFISMMQDVQTPFCQDRANFSSDNSVPLFPMEECYGIALLEANIDQLQAHMSKGEITTTQLTECYKHRISQTDQHVRSVWIWR